MTHPTDLDAAVMRLSDVLHGQIGLRPEVTLQGRLRRCLLEGSSGSGQDVLSYLAEVMSDGTSMQNLINRVTVQETSFFRHPEHFRVLGDEILPALVPPVTIWSAGCANGQEAFSLAMVLDEAGIEGAVVATDLSTEALERAATATYSEREISGLSHARIARHLVPHGRGVRIAPTLHKRVTVLRHNLLDPIPTEVRGCQVVFCRNVLIYFAPDSARSFLDRVADAVPETTLFLGAAESIWQLTDRYQTIRSSDTFTYRPIPATGVGRPAVSTSRMKPVISSIKSTVRPRVQPRIVSAVPEADAAVALELTKVGQAASAAGDVRAAVVAFRKCTFIAPHDPIAHLHLGLALETAGDHVSARRAFAAAEHALVHHDPGQGELAAEGYTSADISQLLAAKKRGD